MALCTIPLCPRFRGEVHHSTDPALVDLCAQHRNRARHRAAWHRTTAAEQVARMAAEALRPWCERCRLRRAAEVYPSTAPGTEGLCTGCREALRNRTTPVAGRLRGVAVAPSREAREALLSSRAETDAVLAQYKRPRVRADCLPGGCNGARPCPWAGCAFHLALSVTDAGSLRLEHPGREVWELAETCALDVAERGGATLEEVGDLVNLTRERVRQIEVRAARRLRRPAAALEGLDPSDRPARPAAPVGRRRIPAVASVEYGEREERVA